MNCVSCGKEIMSGMPFCPFCNAKQPVTNSTNNKIKSLNRQLSSVQTPSLNDSHTEDSKETETPQANQTTVTTDNSKVSVESEEKKTPVSTSETVAVADESSADIISEPQASDETEISDENEHWIPPEETFESAPEETPVANTTNSAETKNEREDMTNRPTLRFNKKKNAPVQPGYTPEANTDGYYNDPQPVKDEEFPVSKGEKIAKVILLFALIIIIALFLIYIIQ